MKIIDKSDSHLAIEISSESKSRRKAILANIVMFIALISFIFFFINDNKKATIVCSREQGNCTITQSTFLATNISNIPISAIEKAVVVQNAHSGIIENMFPDYEIFFRQGYIGNVPRNFTILGSSHNKKYLDSMADKLNEFIMFPGNKNLTILPDNKMYFGMNFWGVIFLSLMLWGSLCRVPSKTLIYIDKNTDSLSIKRFMMIGSRIKMFQISDITDIRILDNSFVPTVFLYFVTRSGNKDTISVRKNDSAYTDGTIGLLKEFVLGNRS